MNSPIYKNLVFVIFYIISTFVYAGDFEKGSAAFKLGNDQKAVEYWKKAIDENNDPRAKYALSKMYRFGLGVEQDFQKRKELLEEAANAGILVAIREVAAGYGSGKHGFSKDLNKSRELYIHAATYGQEEDRNLLSGLYCTNFFGQEYKQYIDACYSSLKKSYQHYQSKLMLADVFFKGKIIERDLTKAFVWFKLYLEQRPKNIIPQEPAFLDIERQLTEQQKIEAEKLLVKARLTPTILFTE